jgi:hypothetical protein
MTEWWVAVTTGVIVGERDGKDGNYEIDYEDDEDFTSDRPIRGGSFAGTPG